MKSRVSPARVDIKHEAQDIIMSSLSAALLHASENKTDEAVCAELRVQAIRVGKMLGYVNWPGIWQQTSCPKAAKSC